MNKDREKRTVERIRMERKKIENEKERSEMRKEKKKGWRKSYCSHKD